MQKSSRKSTLDFLEGLQAAPDAWTFFLVKSIYILWRYFWLEVKIFSGSFNQFAESHHTATKNGDLNFFYYVFQCKSIENSWWFWGWKLKKCNSKLMNLLQTLPIDGIHQYSKSWKDETDWNSISWLTTLKYYLKSILRRLNPVEPPIQFRPAGIIEWTILFWKIKFQSR